MEKQKKNIEMPVQMVPNYGNRKIFTDEQETGMAEFIRSCAEINYYCLTTIDVRRLAYKTVLKNDGNIKMPLVWAKNKCAGIEWLNGFLKRHPSLKEILFKRNTQQNVESIF